MHSHAVRGGKDSFPACIHYYAFSFTPSLPNLLPARSCSQASVLLVWAADSTRSTIRIRVNSPPRRRRYRPADERRRREVLPAPPTIPARGPASIGGRAALILAVVWQVTAALVRMTMMTILWPALRRGAPGTRARGRGDPDAHAAWARAKGQRRRRQGFAGWRAGRRRPWDAQRADEVWDLEGPIVGSPWPDR
jgi:hypothetical protein